MTKHNAQTRAPHPTGDPEAGRSVTVRFVVREFCTPPVHDGLVLGKRSPIGCIAIRRALALLQTTAFTHIEIDDDVVGDIIVRESILRRVPREKLIRMVVQRIKPLMAADEIVHLDIVAEVQVEAEA
jgi:hypothetical protein